MELRNLPTLRTILAMALFMGLAACSTNKEAETDTRAEPVEQAQTQGQADEQMADDPDVEQAQAQTPTNRQQMMQMCPMQVEGTTREVVELDDGVAVDFTTTGDVEELRRRVENMAQMHNQRRADGDGMHGQMHGRPDHMQHDQMQHDQMRGEMTDEQRQMHRQMMQMMSEVTVEAQEIDDGMRMKFTPDDPEQVDALYQMMQQHNQMMMGQQGQQCPMMQMMGGGPVEEQEE